MEEGRGKEEAKRLLQVQLEQYVHYVYYKEKVVMFHILLGICQILSTLLLSLKLRNIFHLCKLIQESGLVVIPIESITS